ncbi:MAG: DNA-deoxyinosine glycosylase [Clostridiales bacterium]|nr:DNA-deoxyinosine glycosylase [Clostridiales bacterium]
MRVEHPFSPIFDRHSAVLILGSMPSPATRERGFPYAHPQNRFWPVMEALFAQPVPSSMEQSRAFLLRNRLALWDVLHSCEIEGASDASIQTPVPNDLSPILQGGNIRAIFTTGGAAHRLYRRHLLPLTGLPDIALPSTSPANAKMRLPELVEHYRLLLDYLT